MSFLKREQEHICWRLARCMVPAPMGDRDPALHLRSEPLAVRSSSVLTQDLTRFQMQMKKPWDIATKDH